MRKLLLLFSLAALTGCAWLGFGDDADTVAANEPDSAIVSSTEPDPEPAPATKKTAAKKTAKTVKGAKSEAQIKAELDAMGKKIASQSARTLLPNKSKPEFKQVGKNWIASYIDVDSDRVRTEMHPSTKGKGQYTGTIHYQEKFMQCTGTSRQNAMQGNCQQVKTRNLKELIYYDGKQWQD